MLDTDELYDELWESTDHIEETKVIINGVEYGSDKLVSVSTRGAVFNGNELTIGGAVMGTISIEMRSEGKTAKELSDIIPRAAKVEPFVRLSGKVTKSGSIYNDGTEKHSDWLPQGVFWIAERSAVGWSSLLKISGEDNMTWAEYDFPTVLHSWPATDVTVVQDIATAMGVDIDTRTTDLMNKGYTLPKPEYYTMREVLGYIAAMYCGNFVFTKEGKLLLLTLSSLPSAPSV